MSQLATTIEPLCTVNGSQSFEVKITKDGSKYHAFKLVAKEVKDDKPCSPPHYENVVVIDSVSSGTGRNKNNHFYNIVIKPIFDIFKIQHHYFKTTGPKSISTYAKSLDLSKSYTVIFISGDTSISEFINNLPPLLETSNGLKHTISILPLPMGTGNAFSSSIGHKCPIQTLSSFLHNRTQPSHFPLYEVIFPNGKTVIFFIILSLGLHANVLHLCENDPQYKKYGEERFKLAFEKVMTTYDLNVRLQIPELDLSGAFSYFILINTPNLESSYIPSPLSDPFLEQLHVLGYSSSLNNEDLLNYVTQGYSNKLGDELVESSNMVYKPISRNVSIVLTEDEESEKYKYDICCDGLLFNLRDMLPENPTKEDYVLKTNFKSRDSLPFEVQVLK
ncbi:hypothetical protein KAFR_0H00200 [Kazachstania africana CBS 2517]|uniref:DAGKc domain-containing protein n=1 Tax=Kazachstania africana (strain ATCC 22294 / BCRC 22015 / CBS 2517 / CECT 1963 / NBRC 1671 / NRRL Y-8276) TaxID=1071382 RepID=H2AYM3_KAZAF|nr:hypothetical protein KAFR_0H00200 [Kazachstania africana CBS 2517]CCF59429.1 hypothetical protein KAFR_0H00200 [Kazachstania africana CBS 2517]